MAIKRLRIETGNGTQRSVTQREDVQGSARPNIDAFATWLLGVIVAVAAWIGTILTAFGAWLQSLNWKVFVWNLVTLPFVGLLYFIVNAHGLRSQMPLFALRLYKIPIPGFSFLRHYNGLHDLELAHILSLLLCFFVWYFWIVIIKVLLYGYDETVEQQLNHKTYYLLLFTLAGVIIIGDAIVFFCGLQGHVGSMWGETSPFVPVVATGLYMTLLGSVALVHVRLSEGQKKQTPNGTPTSP